MKIRNRHLLLATLLSFFCALAAQASDHADPIFNRKDDAGLTGLFAFPVKDKMVFILNIHRGLKTKPPFKLEAFHYTLHFDGASAIHFDNQPNNLRYGGTVTKPEKIAETASVTLTLNNDASLKNVKFQGFPNNKAIKIWAGLRDDPFIFPSFFGTNVISMVMEMPMDQLPKHDGHFLLWATTQKRQHKQWQQIDHVGRSARTQNPRLDFINTLHPSAHVQAIRKEHDHPSFLQKELMSHIQPLFAIRHYDIFPDVMIYSHDKPAGFPNGRQLTDDVAALTCTLGDCMLWELSFADSDKYPRQTKNDKPFLQEFPYLADPW